MPHTCPRCGQLGYPYVLRRKDRMYLYFRHRADGGRWRRCYIGPVKSAEEILKLYTTYEVAKKLLNLRDLK
ncbi:MAG: hypothetical protein QXT13_12440 [Pyrobaculum sp.]